MQSIFKELEIKLAQLFYGRNGFDKLSGFLFILSLVFNIANSFVRAIQPSAILSVISFSIVAVALFRVLSKNIVKRRQENFKFENLLKLISFDKTMTKIKSRIKNLNLRIRYFKTHRFRKCPRCKNFLRLKNKKGKREINCPNCGHKMVVRIWI